MHNLSAAKSTGFCLSAFIDQRCFERMLELDRDGVVERKIIFEAWQSDAFAAPRLRLASGTFGFNCGIRVLTPMSYRALPTRVVLDSWGGPKVQRTNELLHVREAMLSGVYA
jgi:hypothetical protein